MESRKLIAFRVLESEAEKLENVARKNNITVSEQVRRYIEKGMTVDAYQNDETQILANMQTSLKTVLEPQIERMVKIMVKNSISASVDMLYTGIMMNRVCSPDLRPRLEDNMEEARRLAIRFVQLGKGSVDDFLTHSMEYLNTKWEEG